VLKREIAEKEMVAPMHMMRQKKGANQTSKRRKYVSIGKRTSATKEKTVSSLMERRN